jgi:hypothetical protein
MDNDNMQAEGSKCCPFNFTTVTWWATLVVAVLAIPALGVVVAVVSGTKGLFGVSIVIVACWACTYLGMRLMKNPKISDKFDS